MGSTQRQKQIKLEHWQTIQQIGKRLGTLETTNITKAVFQFPTNNVTNYKLYFIIIYLNFGIGIPCAGHRSTKPFPLCVMQANTFDVEEKVGTLKPTGSEQIKTKTLVTKKKLPEFGHRKTLRRAQ